MVSETPPRKPHRTLLRVFDLKKQIIITSDDLREFDEDHYNVIRREATKTRQNGERRYTCEKCGYYVYAPIHGPTGLRLWKHFRGAPKGCEWYTGDTKAIDTVSAAQFKGAQESPLHSYIKHKISELLEHDQKTSTGSVVIDRFLQGAKSRRRPDVRATYDGVPTAFEIQLSTTQLPLIMGRERFYEEEGFRLIWLTWSFQANNFGQIQRSFKDIFYSHNHNLFSIDPESISRSISTNQFQVRAHWIDDGIFNSRFFPISELSWGPNGLAYAIAPWHVSFQEKWLAMSASVPHPWRAKRALLEELVYRTNLSKISVQDLERMRIDDLLGCLLSLSKGYPVDSKEGNLTQRINSFLSSPDRHPLAQIVKRAIEVFERSDLFARKSVQIKLYNALETKQYGRKSVAGKIAIKLFPELV